MLYAELMEGVVGKARSQCEQDGEAGVRCDGHSREAVAVWIDE